jgi:hypothetical protein
MILANGRPDSDSLFLGARPRLAGGAHLGVVDTLLELRRHRTEGSDWNKHGASVRAFCLRVRPAAGIYGHFVELTERAHLPGGSRSY